MGKLSVKKINIDGKVLNYELNLNALINFEDETGKELTEMKEGDKFNLKDIRALLWAGLNEHKDITIEEAGKLINPNNMYEVANRLMEIYEESMPESNGETKGKNKNRSAG